MLITLKIYEETPTNTTTKQYNVSTGPRDKSSVMRKEDVKSKWNARIVMVGRNWSIILCIIEPSPVIMGRSVTRRIVLSIITMLRRDKLR